MEKLGSITFTAALASDGSLDVQHETKLEPAQLEMLGAMGRDDKRLAVELRREACAAVAAYLMFVHNPDCDVQIGFADA